MKNLLLIFLVFFSFNLYCQHSIFDDFSFDENSTQDVDSTFVGAESEFGFLVGFRYVYMPLNYKNKDVSKLNSIVKKQLSQKKIKVLSKNFRFWPKELKDNPGLCVYFKLDYKEDDEYDVIRVNLEFKNIKDEEIKVLNYAASEDHPNPMNKIAKEIASDIETLKYKFNNNYYTKLEYQELEKISKNVTYLKEYFNKNNISYSKIQPFEGIFAKSSYLALIGKRVVDEKLAFVQSYSADNKLPEWVKLNEDEQDMLEDGFKISRVKVIVVNSINRNWAPGEIKADLFVTTYDDDDQIYGLQGQWINGNKTTSYIRATVDAQKRQFYINGALYKKIK